MEGEKKGGIFGRFSRPKKEEPQAKAPITRTSTTGSDLPAVVASEPSPTAQSASSNQTVQEKPVRKIVVTDSSSGTSVNSPKSTTPPASSAKTNSNDASSAAQLNRSPPSSPKSDSKTMTEKMVKMLQESKGNDGPVTHVAASKSPPQTNSPLTRLASFHQNRLADVISLGDVMLETNIESRAIEVRVGLQEIDRGDNSSNKVTQVLCEMQILIDMMVARGKLSDAIILATLQLEVAKKAVKFVRSLRASLPAAVPTPSVTPLAHKRSKTALPDSNNSVDPDLPRQTSSSYDDTEAKLFEWYSMAHYLLGSLLRIKKDYNEATAHLWDCIELRETVKQLRSSVGAVDDIMGFAFGLLSVCYDSMGDQEKCFECHLKSLTECSALGK